MPQVTAENAAMRISELEKCTAGLAAQLPLVAERTKDIYDLVKELRDEQRSSSRQSGELLVSQAQNVQRWESYERERKRMQKQIDEIEVLAKSNQLTLAKNLLIGGGGGIVGSIIGSILTIIVQRIVSGSIP